MTILHCDNLQEASKKAAAYVIKALTFKNDCIFAFPTGRSVIEMYKQLVLETKEKKLDWSNAISFNLDEYYKINPLFKSSSYHNYMNNNFFNFVNFNKDNIHFPYHCGMNELDINKYSEKISSLGGIDLAILGVGINGHIAFNEPGSELDSDTRLVKLSDATRLQNAFAFGNDMNNVPQYAATIGLKDLLQAKKIILVACGQEKKEALEKLMHAEEYDPQWPITALHNFDNLILLTDLYYNN